MTTLTRRAALALFALTPLSRDHAFADPVTTRDFMAKAIEDIKQHPNLKRDNKFAFMQIPRITPFVDWDFYYTEGVMLWEPNAGQDLPLVQVPKGFVTDLASVPPALWSIFPPTGRYAYAAVVHDYLYWFQTVSREVADKTLAAAMADAKVAQGVIDSFYDALRLAGGSAWNANVKARANGEKRILAKFPDDPLISWADWRTRPDVFKP